MKFANMKFAKGRIFILFIYLLGVLPNAAQTCETELMKACKSGIKANTVKRNENIIYMYPFPSSYIIKISTKISKYYVF